MKSELESLRVRKIKYSSPIYPVHFKASPLASRTLLAKTMATLLKYFVMVGSRSIAFLNSLELVCHPGVQSKLKIHLKNGTRMQVQKCRWKMETKETLFFFLSKLPWHWNKTWEFWVFSVGYKYRSLQSGRKCWGLIWRFLSALWWLQHRVSGSWM